MRFTPIVFHKVQKHVATWCLFFGKTLVTHDTVYAERARLDKYAFGAAVFL